MRGGAGLFRQWGVRQFSQRRTQASFNGIVGPVLGKLVEGTDLHIRRIASILCRLFFGNPLSNFAFQKMPRKN